jgi:hypothetical protein
MPNRWARSGCQNSSLIHAQAQSAFAQAGSPSPQVKAAAPHVRRLKQNQRKRKLILSLGGSDTKGYFMASAIEIIEELGVSCWDNVETLFKSFFWVEKIHRGTFRTVWNALKAVITHIRKE